MSVERQERVAVLRHALALRNRIKHDIVPCRIKKGVYLGSLGAARNRDALKSEKVTHILTVASSLTSDYPSEFVYKTIEIMDKEDANIAEYFDECFNFIEEAHRMGGRVLVHCFAGRSRSVTIVVAYLMKKYGMSLPKALEYVRKKRSVASPNYGFMKLLENFEKSLQGENIENSQEV